MHAADACDDSSSKRSKLRRYTGFCKSNRGGSVPTGKVSSLQLHCFRIIQTKNMMSSAENLLNHRFSTGVSRHMSVSRRDGRRVAEIWCVTGVSREDGVSR